jgi:hypothetical protein
MYLFASDLGQKKKERRKRAECAHHSFSFCFSFFSFAPACPPYAPKEQKVGSVSRPIFYPRLLHKKILEFKDSQSFNLIHSGHAGSYFQVLIKMLPFRP